MHMYFHVCVPVFLTVYHYPVLYDTCTCSKETVRVHATVTEHSKTAKVIVFKKKRRKNYKRKRGMYMYIVHEYVCVHVYVYGTMYVVRVW